MCCPPFPWVGLPHCSSCHTVWTPCLVWSVRGLMLLPFGWAWLRWRLHNWWADCNFLVLILEVLSHFSLNLLHVLSIRRPHHPSLFHYHSRQFLLHLLDPNRVLLQVGVGLLTIGCHEDLQCSPGLPFGTPRLWAHLPPKTLSPLVVIRCLSPPKRYLCIEYIRSILSISHIFSRD